MKNVLMVLVLGFAFVGCKSAPVASIVNTVGCQVEATVDAEVTSVIVSTLACSNPSQVQADVSALVAKSNICKASAAPQKLGAVKGKLGGSAIGLFVCPLAVNAVSGMLTSQIPAAWGCTGGAALPSLQAKLLAGCEAKL